MLVILNTSFHFFLVPLSLSLVSLITSSAFSLPLCLPSPSPFPFSRSVSNLRSVSILLGSVSSFSVLPFQLSIFLSCSIPMGDILRSPFIACWVAGFQSGCRWISISSIGCEKVLFFSHFVDVRSIIVRFLVCVMFH